MKKRSLKLTIAVIASLIAVSAPLHAATESSTTTKKSATTKTPAKKTSKTSTKEVKTPPPAPEEVPPPPPPPPPVTTAPEPAPAALATGDAAVDDLLRILDEESAAATKTKLNIDFVPGMITVLHRRDLLAKGVRNVYEALALVPGIELSMTAEGQPQFLVRGIGKTFASTKIKFLLNGIDVNTTVGPQIGVHTIPIEQIDRIEVVRGPGSAIYGEYALAGVVDIKTREDTKGAYARIGDVAGYAVGGTYANAPPGEKYNYSLIVGKGKTDGGDVKTGKDRLGSAPPALANLSNAPGKSNERENMQDVLFKFKYDQTEFVAQHVKTEFGDHFGVNNVLPEDSDQVVRSWTVNSAKISVPWMLENDTRLEVGLDWMNFVGDTSGQMVMPAGYASFGTTGALGGPHYEETRTTVHVALDVPAQDHHKLIGGFEAAYVEQGDSWNERNFDPDLLGPPPQPGAQVPYQKYTGTENWIEEGLTRRILSVYAQDQYDGFGALTLTAGIRIDRYSDIGNSFSPRFAAVYQVSRGQTLKFQYSDSFRPPSFLEMYSKNNPIVEGNPDINPERMHTYEFGYIYNDGGRVFRATSFVSELHDVIVVNSTTRRYENGGEANFRGLEFEFVVPLIQRLKLDGNISLLDSESTNVANPNSGTAQSLANLGVLYQILNDQFLNVQYRWVGSRSRSAGDTRDNLDPYQTVDLTYSATGVKWPGLTLRGGIKNIFDADVKYPAPANTYPDDYPRPGRQWWVSAEYAF